MKASHERDFATNPSAILGEAADRKLACAGLPAGVPKSGLCCKNELWQNHIIGSLFDIDDSALQSESFPDELNLSYDIPFRQPPHLAFSDHVQNLVALNRPPCSIKRSKALAGIHPPLDRSMVLFHYII
jgi:hypothetical protein